MSDEPVMATTWEQCARHVEAGGVVEVNDHGWAKEYLTAVSYRMMDDGRRPGDGSLPRRLVPIPAPDEPETAEGDDWRPRRLLPLPVASEPTGAERYLAERRADPEYAAAFEAQREALGGQHPTVEVPDGHELVVLPCDVVDDWASDGVPGSRRAVILLDACRDAVARRPKPAPKTERVHWSEAVGRKDPHDGTITMIGVPRIYFGQDSWMDVTDPDGMVEVMIENQS